MTYTAHRDHRFYYVHEVIFHIEERQCGNCVFRNLEDPEYPMCVEIGGSLAAEIPVQEIDDHGDNGLICTKYKQGDQTPPQVEGQESLF